MRALIVAAACWAVSHAAVVISYEATSPLNVVSDIYLAFNIDTGSLYNGMDFRDAKLRAFTAQLAPSIVRVGGTAADYSFYFPNAPYLVGQPNACATCGKGASAIGTEMLDEIVDFMLATDNALLFDLNGLAARTGAGPWNPAMNATALLGYLSSMYGSNAKLGKFGYSVGNEPSLWPGPKVKTQQLAHDAVTLKGILPPLHIGVDVYGSSFTGIDAGEAADFLPTALAGGVTGMTVHKFVLSAALAPQMLPA